MARDPQVELDAPLAFEATVHQRAVALRHAPLPEGGAQPAPGRFAGGEQQHTRGLDVEPVHHAASQAALADAVDLGMPRH